MECVLLRLILFDFYINFCILFFNFFLTWKLNFYVSFYFLEFLNLLEFWLVSMNADELNVMKQVLIY